MLSLILVVAFFVHHADLLTKLVGVTEGPVLQTLSTKKELVFYFG